MFDAANLGRTEHGKPAFPIVSKLPMLLLCDPATLTAQQ